MTPGALSFDLTHGTIPLGSRVRCERKRATAGTWRLYSGRTGTVVAVHDHGRGRNRQREIGVAFAVSNQDHENLRADAWFLPDELVYVTVPV